MSIITLHFSGSESRALNSLLLDTQRIFRHLTSEKEYDEIDAVKRDVINQTESQIKALQKIIDHIHKHEENIEVAN